MSRVLDVEIEDELMALQEASSILTSVMINYEKRSKLTVVERELLSTIREWLAANAPEAVA
jgi:hypothetical protein